MFHFFKKNQKNISPSDEAIVAMADGKMVDITTIADEMFAKKLLGDGVAFQYHTDKVTLCAPANGILSVLFPTGHAFGITMENGVELIVHCGIDTVKTNGTGFIIQNKKQGDYVHAKEPIVEVDLATLKKTYDMTTMLVITNAKQKNLKFIDFTTVKLGQNLLK